VARWRLLLARVRRGASSSLKLGLYSLIRDINFIAAACVMLPLESRQSKARCQNLHRDEVLVRETAEFKTAYSAFDLCLERGAKPFATMLAVNMN
jgi:hypothetical protein